MENNEILASRPMDLSGTCNTRELGGYPLERGGSTRYHACLRSDGLYALTQEDKDKLKSYGVKRIIDLRTVHEVQQQPCVLGEADGVEYFNIPLKDQIFSGGLEGKLPERMSQLYISLLDNSGGQIAEVLKKISQCQETVLFNCAIGKDRTGVISMLLLMLSGVTKEAVLKDYEVSGENIRPMIEKQKEVFKRLKVPENIFKSDCCEMEKTILYLEKVWKTAEGYMRSIGLTGEIDELRNKLAGEG